MPLAALDPVTASAFDSLVPVRVVRTVLGISRSTVYSMLQRGEIPGVRVGQRTLVRTSDLTAYLAALKSPIANGAVS